MAFFGSDGLEHQLRQLKAQLSAKDHEITSIRNELKKKGDELHDAKKIREAAEYKLQTEAERALKAENALQQKSTELSNVRLQYDNLECTLRSANQKLKVGEKENGRLQYDLDVASAQSLKEEQVLLQAKIKDLEARLKKSEQEKESLRAEGSKSANGGLKRSATDFFGASISPSSKRSTRRRSTSLSSDNRVSELEAELEGLRAAQGPSAIEIDKLKTLLANAKKELDKVTNAKLAMERASKREYDELKSLLEDANYELEDWRRNGGAGGKVELERVKKEATIQLESFRDKITRLEDQIGDKEHEIGVLKRNVAELSTLEAELESHKETIRALESASSKPTDDSQLFQRIATLESKLSQARSASSSSSSSTAAIPHDRLARQLQRENKTLKTEVESLKEDLQLQDDEILRLRGALPLPGSPSLGAKTSDVESSKFFELEQELEEAHNQISELKDTLKTMTSKAEAREADLEVLDRQRVDLEAQMVSVRSSLETSQARVSELTVQLETIRSESTTHQDYLQDALKELEGVQADLKEAQQQLTELSTKNEDLLSQIEQKSRNDDEIRALREGIESRQQGVIDMETTIASIRAEANEANQRHSAIEQERDLAQKEVSQLREEVSNLMDRVVDVEDRLKEAMIEKKAAVKIVKEKLRENIAEADSLRLRLEDSHVELGQAKAHADGMQEQYEEAAKAKIDLETAVADLRETIANRSTESEARQRDETIFDNDEKIERLQKDLRDERVEHAKELQSATFVLSQDLEAARRRATELEKEVAEMSERPSVEQKEQVTLLQDKISRLRKERDELRISLNFVNHEHRFAQQAAEAERLSASGDLMRAKMELADKNELATSLENEYAQAKDRLNGILDGLNEASEKDGILDKLSDLEISIQQTSNSREELRLKVDDLEARMEESMKEHQLQAAESGTLVSELAIARSKASKAESELAALRRATREHESRIDRLQATLDARIEKEDIVQNAGVREEHESERPGSSMGHSRRRSGLPSPTFGMVENLKIERADLLGRISRRDERIQGLTNELKQAKVNLRLAEDAAAENCEEKEDATRKVTELQSTLEERETELNEARSAVDSARATAEEFSTKINDLTSELYHTRTLSSDNQASLRDLVLTLAIQRKAMILIRRQWSHSLNALKESDMTIDRVREATTTAMEGAKVQLISLSSTILTLQTELEGSRQSETFSLSKISQLQDHLDDIQTKLQRANDTNAEFESTLKRVEELESDLSATRDDIKMKEIDITTLLDKLAMAEKNKGMNEEYQATRDATVIELETARMRVEDLQNELQTLLDNLADLEKSKDEMAEQQAGELEEVRSAQQSQLAALEQQVFELQEDVRAKAEEVSRSDDQAKLLSADLAETRAQLADLVAQSNTGRAAMDEWRDRLAHFESEKTRMDDLTTTSEADKAAIAKLNSKIEEHETASSIIRSERDTLSSKLVQLELDLAISLKNHKSASSRVEQVEAALSSTKDQLQDVLQKAERAEVESRDLQHGLQRLKEENENIKARLDNAAATAPTMGSVAIEEMQDRITELEGSLTLKVQEVDEADDRVREAYKDKAKLEKKVAKLQRQLAAASATAASSETIANTNANKVIPPPASTKMPPPPIPSARAAPTPTTAFTPRTTKSSAPEPSPRQPLRPTANMANVFEPKPSPASGFKRSREEKVDEKPLPADCILLPSPAMSTPKSLAGMPRRQPRTGFTPQRGSVNVFDPNQQPSQPRLNIFAGNE